MTRRRWLLLVILVAGVALLVARNWTGGGGVEAESWVLLDLEGTYAEEVADAPLARLLGEPAISFLDLLLLIRDAGEDPRVAGLVVRIRPLSMGWGKAQEIRAALQIRSGILDADDVRNLREPQHGVVLKISHGAPGHVVDDVRKIDRFRDRPEVPVESFLGRLVVVGHDREAHVGAYLLGVSGKLDRFTCRVGARAGYDRDTPGDVFDRGLDQQMVFVKIDRR